MERAPEERGAAGWVQVADLRQPGEGGRYPVRVLDRRGYEAGMRRHAARPAARVVMYATSWCPVCEKARKFLTSQRIPHVEKDVEKDPGAAAELQRKLAAAGQQAGGVPVFDVGGRLLTGFDEAALLRLVRPGT